MMVDCERINILVENAAEGGYNARALNESIFTEANDLDTLQVNIRDAVDGHFEADNKPKMICVNFVSL